MEALLEVNNLKKSYRRDGRKRLEVLSGVSFALRAGECLGLVGESGCGKSTLCRSIAGLETWDDGEILFRGRPLSVRGGEKELRRQIQMVFQNSFDAVSPHMTAFQIISEPLENFFHMKKAARREEAERLLALVGLLPADLEKYPAQFSGGQLQRVCIARALAARPELLILDEPLSSLDVSVQAQILNLLSDLKEKLRLTCILVSHDRKAVYYLADRILAMEDGKLGEAAPAAERTGREKFTNLHREN